MSAAPRVLISGVVLGQPMGGVRRHNAELLPRAAALLAARGGALAVMEGALPAAIALEAPLERLRSSVPAGPPSLRAIHEGRALRALCDQASAAGAPFDLVHTGHLPIPLRLPVPLVITLHDLRSLELAGQPLARRALAQKVVGLAVARAAAIVTVSEDVAERLARRFRVERSRCWVVPNAADHFTPLPRRAPADAALLYVGHIEPRKNLELVLRALALDPSLPPLELAGAPKPGEEERLRALADELGVGARVRFLGPFGDALLPELYARAACVVAPALVEGFGIPVLEAQRAGAPVCIADAGALPEVAGPEAPRFDPSDPADCAAALRRALALDDDALARAATRAAGYRWDDSAERLVACWEAVAARSST